MTKIIGVAGVMGAGKTTLTRALGAALDATTLHWDDFDDVSRSPPDFVQWYNENKHHGDFKDYSAWDYAVLAQSLKSLKEGAKQSPGSREFAVFDAPLGRRHLQTGQYIDFLIWIELPPDISLVRWILRDFGGRKASVTASDILDELQYYVSESRPMFVENKEFISEADLILDGTKPVRELTQIVLQKIGKPTDT